VRRTGRFFGGVLRVLIPDNLKAVVLAADAVSTRLSPGWLDYAQHVGFATDPTRIRSLQDKPRVERAVPYVRGNFWAGESFTDLADAQNRMEIWCRERAGMRVHGTTARRPAEMFAELEAGYLLPLPEPYDQPVFTRVKVHRDYHVEVARRCTRCRSICSARVWTPGSTASAGHFLVSRRPHVTRRAMISRTQVRSARPPCVCTVRIRKWSSAG
jgi:hypothetical protein